MADMLAEKMQKQAMDNKMEAEEKAELDALASEKKVSEAGEMPMSGAMQAKKQQIMDEKEEKAELDEIAASDPVNAESKAAMADMLAEKMQKQAMDNKIEAEEKAELG